MKDQLGLMQRMRLAKQEAQEASVSQYSGYVYDFLTIAPANELAQLLCEEWDDLTHIFPPTMQPVEGRIVGRRLRRRTK